MRFWINLEIEIGKLEVEVRTDHLDWKPWYWLNVGKYRWGFGWLWFSATWDK